MADQMSNDAAHHLAYRKALIQAMKFEIIPLLTAPEALSQLPDNSAVTITCSPKGGIEATTALAEQVRGLGHLAVPHLAARMVRSQQHVAEIARWLRRESIEHIFVIGGDVTDPIGPYRGASDFLLALLDTDHGLTSIGVAAYPDGHPIIDREVLDKALYHKQAILGEAQIRSYAGTQMCFDAEQIYRWLTTQRSAGLTLPIHLGVAGIVDRAKLMTTGARLGVGTSLRFLKKNRAAIGRLMTTSSYEPNQILEPLGPSLQALDVEALHCFTFNQVGPTARWRQALLAAH